MKRGEKNILTSIYYFAIGMLLLPMIQYSFDFVKEEPLNGSYKKEKIALTKPIIKEVLSGHFQNTADKFWQNEHGFRSWFIRLNNQINYSLFSHSNASGTIICRNNMLITEADIKSYLGKDFIGEKRIDEVLDKAKQISDTLKNRGTAFFIMIAPSKASIYPESIPQKYFELYKPQTTNYEVYKKGLQKRGINLFDTKRIILDDLSYQEYPVFPKNGVHWSGNTVAKLSDTLMRYIRNELNVSVPKIQLIKGEETILNYRFTDYDIGKAMNLLWNVSDDVLHYPEMAFIENPKTKPNLLGVGDSFIQSFYGFYPVIDSAFSSESNLWYYNKTVGWPLSLAPYGIRTMQLDLALEIENRDIVLLEMNEENLNKGAYGFIDDLHDHFFKKEAMSEFQREIYTRLSKDHEIDKKANKLAPILGYTVAQMKNSIIRNKVKNEWLIDFDFDKEVELTKLAIRKNPKWLQKVKEKAIRKNIDLETAIERDAKWLVKQKLGK